MLRQNQEEHVEEKKIQYLCLYIPFCARLFFFSSLQFPPSGVSVSDRLPLFFHLLLSLFMSLFLSELQLGCKETVIHLPRIKQGCQQPDRHTKVLKLSPPSPSPSLPLTHTQREKWTNTDTARGRLTQGHTWWVNLIFLNSSYTVYYSFSFFLINFEHMLQTLFKGLDIAYVYVTFKEDSSTNTWKIKAGTFDAGNCSAAIMSDLWKF